MPWISPPSRFLGAKGATRPRPVSGGVLACSRGRPGAGTGSSCFPALRSKLNRYVGTMSGGERKMTAIARALMLSPRVLVLDEPTAGLSAVLTESVLAGQVRALADRGHAVLLVEQKAQAALRLAHTASVLVRGQVVMSAPAAEVLASREVGEVFLGGRGRRQK